MLWLKAERAMTSPSSSVTVKQISIPERAVFSIREAGAPEGALYVNGVLVLRLPLSEASKPRRVNVIGSTEGTEVRADNGGSADRQPAANGGTDEARQSPQSQQAQDVAAGTATSA